MSLDGKQRTRAVRTDDRERRDGEVVLGRAAVAGVLVGALIGASVMLPDLVEYLRADEPDVAYLIGPSGLLLGAFFGGLVGLVSALCAAVAWLLTVDGPPARPRLSRVVAGLVAAGVVICAAVFPEGGFHVVTVGFALVAGLLAAALAPRVGYRES
ncbi:MAG: hypothetical protein ABWX96_09030 [Propionibacteriaceae bacterium]